ncbi:MAG: enoyl-CoA hydratase/isomerase family protein [Bacteroidota bacterium]
MKFTRIEYAAAGRIGTISLNRPEKRNALDDVMVAELTQAFITAAKDASVKVVVLRANGPVFSAGADLDYLQRIAKFDFNANLEDCQKLIRLFASINQMKKPVVAVVEGPALAGGCGLATACDFIIADKERSEFGYPEVRIGFIPAIVLVYLLRRVSESHAKELVFTGKTISARRAYEIGLVNEVVPTTEMNTFVNRFLQELVEKSSGTSMSLMKEIFAKLPGMNLSDALDYAANMNAVARMTDDCRKGISAFLNKEKIIW